MKSTDDFDRVHDVLLVPVGDWCQDFETELGNAATGDPKYHQLRLRYVDEFLVLFPAESDLVTLNMMRAKGEALMGIGRRDEAEAVFAATVERFPDDAWAYIGWADQYAIAGPAGPKDLPRAEELLQRALARTTLVHRNAVLDPRESGSRAGQMVAERMGRISNSGAPPAARRPGVLERVRDMKLAA